MKWKSTLLLLVAVAGLGALIWYLEFRDTGLRQQRLRGGKAVLIRADNVDYLRIEHTNYVMLCRQERGQWRLEEPIVSYADNGVIRRILQGLEDLPSLEVITEDQRRDLHAALHDFGLALPDVRIFFRQDGRESALLVGDRAAVGDGLYIMETNRSEVIVTSQALWELIPEAPAVVRSRKLFPKPVARLTRLEIQRTSGFLQVARPEDGGPWMIQQPLVARASGLFVHDLARKFLSLQIEEFVADDVRDFAPYGLDEPAAEITLWPEAMGPYTIVVGRTVDDNPDWVYVRTAHGNSVYAVSKQILADANVDETVLRDRELLHLRLAAIGYIEMRSSETVIELEKDDAGSWRLTKPVRRAADNDVVWRTLESWDRIRIRTFYSDPPPAGEPPRFGARVTIAASRPDHGGSTDAPQDGREMLVLDVFTAPWAEDQVVVKLRHEDTLYGIPAEVLQTTSINPLDYYDRHILQLSPADVRRIEVRRGGEVQTVQRDGTGRFEPLSAQGRQPAPDAVDRMLNEVGSLVARRFVAEDPDDLSAFGLAQPAGSVTLGLTGEAGISKTLLFGDRVPPDGVFAMIQGQTTVFEVPESAREQLLGDVLIRPVIVKEEAHGSAADPPGSS